MEGGTMNVVDGLEEAMELEERFDGSMRLLETNLGRSRRAKDLLLQTIRESMVALAVVAEPYRVLDTPDWVGYLNGLVVVTWTSSLGASAAGVLFDRGNGTL
jgi:hypothetical protein